MATYNVNLNLSTAAAMAALNNLHIAAGKPINTRINFSQPLGRITGDVRDFDKSLSAASARVTAFGAVAGSFYLVSKAVTEAAKSMMLVDKELIELNTFLGQSQGKLKEFGNSLFAIAKNTSTSFSAVSEAAKEFARQGLSMEETLKRTNDALVLSRISGLGAAESVTALTTAVNSFNKSGLTSSEVINKLIQVDSQFSVSSNDLAQALSRVGSSAQDSGLSIDQLVAAVTTAQQTTGRGGAVIGNALKTIFTRMKRPEVIDQLEAIGVSVKDSSGYFLDGLTILQNYTTATKNLSQTEKARTAELLGGIFQINVLNSLLNDVSKSNGIYARALKASSSATDEAFEKNEALNESLSATLERTKANLTQKGAAIATPLLTPVIKTGTALINKTLNVFDGQEKEGSEEGEKTGRSFGESLLKSLGAMLAGPGLMIVGILALAIGKKVFSFGINATKNLLGITSSSQNILNLQNLISSTLSNQPVIMQKILAGQMSQTQGAQLLLGIMKQQGAQLQMNQTISSTLATTLAKSGHTVSPTVGLKRKAMGHIPKADQGMERAGALAGGYSPGAVIKAPSSIGGIMNTAEKVKNVPGFRQPFINPPEGSRAGNLHKKNSIKQTGINPYAYDGFIPNFNPMKWVNNEIVLNNVSTKQLSPKALELNNIADGGIGLKNNDIYDTITGRIKKTILFSEKTGEKKAFEKKTMDNLRLFLEGKLPKGHPSETMYEAEYLMQSKQGKISKEDLRKEIPNGDFKPGGRAGNFVTRAYENEARKLVNQGKRQFIPGKQNSFLDLYLSKKTKGGMQGYEVKMGEYTPTEILTKILKEKFANRKHNNDKERHLNFGTYGLIATYNKGFIPNFAYLDNVKKLESKAGNGTAIFDAKPFPHVRNSSQPTFQSAISDHGGLQNALRDSASMQKGAGLIKSGGFIPNFANKVRSQAQMDRIEAYLKARAARPSNQPEGMNSNASERIMQSMMIGSMISSLPMAMSGFANENNVRSIANTQRAVAGGSVVGGIAMGAMTGAGMGGKLGGVRGAAIGGVIGGLTQIPAAMMGFSSANELEKAVKDEIFLKAKDGVLNKFNKLTQNVGLLSQSIGDLDAAYSDPNVSTEALLKLGKKQQELLKSISKTNPEAAMRLATASTAQEKQSILLDTVDSATKEQAIKASSVSFLQLDDNKRNAKEVESFFSDLFAQIDISKIDVKNLRPENFKQSLIDSGGAAAIPVFKDADSKLGTAFIQYIQAKEKVSQEEEIAKNKLTNIRRGPAAIRRQNEKTQSLRSAQRLLISDHLDSLVGHASAYGEKAAISAKRDVNVAKASEEEISKFNSKIRAQSKDSPVLRQFEGQEPSVALGMKIKEAISQTQDPKEKNVLEGILQSNNEAVDKLGTIAQIEDSRKALDLKLLSLQEQLTFGGGIKTSLNFQAKKESRDSTLRPALQYKYGKQMGSADDMDAGRVNFAKSVKDKYTGMDFGPGAFNQSIEIGANLGARNLRSSLLRDSGLARSMGDHQLANAMSSKANDSQWLRQTALRQTQAYLGIDSTPDDVKDGIRDSKNFNRNADAEKSGGERLLAGAEAAIKSLSDTVVQGATASAAAITSTLQEYLRAAFANGVNIQNAILNAKELGKNSPTEMTNPAAKETNWTEKAAGWGRDAWNWMTGNTASKSIDVDVASGASAFGMSKGFIPNFSYLNDVKKLESKASNNNAIFDTKPFPHVRNSSQPTFQSAINDHGGLQNALRDSVGMQRSVGLVNAEGFIPNFGKIIRPNARMPRHDKQQLRGVGAGGKVSHFQKGVGAGGKVSHFQKGVGAGGKVSSGILPKQIIHPEVKKSIIKQLANLPTSTPPIPARVRDPRVKIAPNANKIIEGKNAFARRNEAKQLVGLENLEKVKYHRNVMVIEFEAGGKIHPESRYKPAIEAEKQRFEQSLRDVRARFPNAKRFHTSQDYVFDRAVQRGYLKHLDRTSHPAWKEYMVRQLTNQPGLNSAATPTPPSSQKGASIVESLRKKYTQFEIRPNHSLVGNSTLFVAPKGKGGNGVLYLSPEAHATHLQQEAAVKNTTIRVGPPKSPTPLTSNTLPQQQTTATKNTTIRVGPPKTPERPSLRLQPRDPNDLMRASNRRTQAAMDIVDEVNESRNRQATRLPMPPKDPLISSKNPSVSPTLNPAKAFMDPPNPSLTGRIAPPPGHTPLLITPDETKLLQLEPRDPKYDAEKKAREEERVKTLKKRYGPTPSGDKPSWWRRKADAYKKTSLGASAGKVSGGLAILHAIPLIDQIRESKDPLKDAAFLGMSIAGETLKYKAVMAFLSAFPVVGPALAFSYAAYAAATGGYALGNYLEDKYNIAGRLLGVKRDENGQIIVEEKDLVDNDQTKDLKARLLSKPVIHRSQADLDRRKSETGFRHANTAIERRLDERFPMPTRPQGHGQMARVGSDQPVPMPTPTSSHRGSQLSSEEHARLKQELRELEKLEKTGPLTPEQLSKKRDIEASRMRDWPELVAQERKRENARKEEEKAQSNFLKFLKTNKQILKNDPKVASKDSINIYRSAIGMGVNGRSSSYTQTVGSLNIQGTEGEVAMRYQSLPDIQKASLDEMVTKQLKTDEERARLAENVKNNRERNILAGVAPENLPEAKKRLASHYANVALAQQNELNQVPEEKRAELQKVFQQQDEQRYWGSRSTSSNSFNYQESPEETSARVQAATFDWKTKKAPELLPLPLLLPLPPPQPTSSASTSGHFNGFIPAFSKEREAVLSSPSYVGHRNATPMHSSVYKNAVINSAEIEVPASEVYNRMFGPAGANMKPKNPSQTHAILNPAQQQALGFSAGFIPNFSAEQFTAAITEAMRNGISSFAGGMIPSVSHSNVVNINDGRSYQGSSNEMMDGVLDILQSKYPKEMGKLGPKIAKR